MNLKNCFFLLIGFLFSASSIEGLHAQSGMSKIAYFDNEKVRRLTALEHYREKSADSPESKNLFEALYEDHVDIICMQPGVASDLGMAQRAKAFLATKPQDGFSIAIASYWAFVGDRKQEFSKRKRHFNRLRAVIPKKLNDCSDFQKVLAYDALWELTTKHVQLQTGGQRQIINGFGNALLDWFINDIEYEQNLSLYVRLLDRIHESTFFYSIRGQELATIFEKRKGLIDPWMRDILSGAMEIHNKKGDREKKYANAENYLLQAHGLKPENPEAATMMIRVASAQGHKDQAYQWFDRAIEADPSYLKSWQAALEHLAKTNSTEKLRIAEQALGMASEMRDGPMIYLRTVNSIAKSLVEIYDEENRREILEKVSSACENYLLDGYAQGEFDAEYVRSVNFTIAYQLELFEEASAILESYQGKVEHPLPYRPIFGTISQTVNRLKAIVGSDKETVLEIEKMLLTELMTKDDCEYFIDLVNRLQERAPATADFAQTMLELAQQHLRFHKGEWVELKIDQSLSHWSPEPSREWRLNLLGRVRQEKFEVSDRNTIVNVSEKKHGGYLMYRPAFPLPFQVDAEIKSTPHGPVNIYTSRLIYTDIEEDEEGRLGREEKRSVIVSDNPFEKQRSVRFSGSALAPLQSDPFVYTSEKAKLNLFLCEGYAEMYQTGKESEHVCRSYTRQYGKERSSDWRARIGVGPEFSFAGESEFGSLRIRKADFTPPPRELEEKVEYLKRRIEKEPRHNLCIFLSSIQISFGNFEAALEAANQARALKPKCLFARLYQGICYTQMGQYKSAERVLQETFKIPNTGYQGVKSRWAADWHSARLQARAHYAFLLSTCPDDSMRDVEKAAKQIALIDKKVWIASFKPRIDHALAAIAAEKGDFEEAEKYLYEATKPREEYRGGPRVLLPLLYVEDQCRAMKKSIKAKKPYRLKTEKKTLPSDA